MKTVFDKSSQIVHLWASKAQPSATTRVRDLMGGGRAAQAFFEGERYYSYGHHYCIGRHLPDGYVALNLEKNSSTTNGHVWEARHATKHLKQVLVLDPDSDEPDLEGTQALVDNLLDKASRAKADGNRPRYLAEASQIVADFNQFSKLVKSKLRIKKLDATTWSPEQHKEHLAKEAAAAKRRAAQHLKLVKAKQADAIAAWRRGENPHLSHELPTMLRLGYRDRTVYDSKGYQTIETSRHADIPVEDAKKLWPFILRVMKGKKDYEVGMPLGYYQLTKIRTNGSIVVGCHDIAFDEIEGIAHQLGLTDTSAAQRAFDGVEA